MPLHNTLDVRSFVTACALAAGALSTGCGGGGTELDAQPTSTTSTIATPSDAGTKDLQHLATVGSIVLTAASAERTESPVVLPSVQPIESPVNAPVASTLAASVSAEAVAVASASAIHPVEGARSAQQPPLVSPTAAVALAVNPNGAASLAEWVDLAQPATNVGAGANVHQISRFENAMLS